MKQAQFNFLGFRAIISLPDPEDSNQIFVEIRRQPGTFDPELYNAYFTDFQFSAASNDPNDWVVEGVKASLEVLASHGVIFHESRPVEPQVVDAGSCESEDLDDIPF